MVLEKEPGYYEDGQFGIRIENILLVQKKNTPNRFGEKDYLGFEHVTLVPYQRRLIDTALLTKTEIDWLNAYHKECWTKVSPLLKQNALAYQWLEKAVTPI